MPGAVMVAMALLKAVRAAEVAILVIMLSALASADDRIAGLTAGAAD